VCLAPETPAPAAPSVFHLTDHLVDATVTAGSAQERPAPRTWPLADAASPWRVLGSDDAPQLAKVAVMAAADRWTITLDRPPQQRARSTCGGIQLALDVPLTYADWESVHVRAHAAERFAGLTVTTGKALPSSRSSGASSAGADDTPPLFSDGSTQTYAIPVHPPAGKDATATFDRIAVLVAAPQKATIDLLEIELIAARRDVQRGASGRPGRARRRDADDALAHQGTTLTWKLTLPEARTPRRRAHDASGREPWLPLRSEGIGGQPIATTVDDHGAPRPGRKRRSTSRRSRPAGRALAPRVGPGTRRLLGAPVVSGASRRLATERRFYIIDGGGADLMSLYGYARKTTPALEALGEGRRRVRARVLQCDLDPALDLRAS
jgi:hypothetical protein